MSKSGKNDKADVISNSVNETLNNIERERVVLVEGADIFHKFCSLEAYADIVMGQSPTGNSCNQTGEGFPLLNGPTEFGPYHPYPKQFTTSPTKFSEKGDILFCVRGSTTGRMNWADQRYVIGRGIAAIRHKQGREFQPFLRAIIEYQLKELLGAATGSTFPNVSKSLLNGMKCPDVPESSQKAIAHILGTIDDKIDLNRRMNETLEAMAQAIFKSWFVDFDGCTEFEDSELGLVPKGWESRKLSDVLELAYGKALKKADRIEGEFPVYGSGGVTGSHNKHLAEGPGIIVGRKGTVGKVYWEDKPFFPIDTVFYVKPQKGIPLVFAYELLRSLGLEDMNTDAAVPGLNRNNAYNKDVCIPDTNALEKFASSVGMLFDKRKQNLRQIEKLISIRDTLLPKLISGELRVDEAEKMVEN